MKHSILLMSIGLCLSSFACGAADNSAADNSATGPVWGDPVEEGTNLDADGNVQSTDDALSAAKIWQLQLPTGSGHSPQTVSPGSLSGYSSIYYYKASDGGQVFMDPVSGITTSGSVHPRTELREMSSTGTSREWTTTGTNTMTVSAKVLKGSHITIGQIFNASNSITLAELQYDSGKFKLFYEEAKGKGQGPYDLGVSAGLNQRYTYKMSLSNGKVEISLNGNKVWSRTPSSGTLKDKFYFKCGNYDQSSTGGSVSKTVRSEVENYSISVVH